MQFTVSMVTTSRKNRYLQVWYGDGHNNTVSLEDTESPKLVLTGNGKEMEIIASYGNGCVLTVEFQYVYEKEGVFSPSAEVYENVGGVCKAVDVKEIESDIEGEDEVENEEKTYSQYLDWGFFGEEYDAQDGADADNTDDGDKETDTPKCGSLNENAHLMADLLVLQEVKSLHIHHAPRIGRCEEQMVFQVESASILNVSFHYVVYRIMENSLERNGTDVESGLISEFDETVENKEQGEITGDFDVDDLEKVTDLYTVEPEIEITLYRDGTYVMIVTAENVLNRAKSSSNFIVQCPIQGLHATCAEYFIRTNTDLECTAYVTEGSDVEFHWFIGELEVPSYKESEDFSVLRYKLTSARDYDIRIEASNNISRQHFDSLEVSVQDPVKDVAILKESQTLLGNMTLFVVLYQYTRVEMRYFLSKQLGFDFDFGDGRRSEPTTCTDENMCFGHTKHLFTSPGKHSVAVYVYNDVSEYVGNAAVWVYEELDNVSVEVVGQAVIGKPTRFVVLQHGKS